MITKENFKQVLEALGFKKELSINIYTKYFKVQNCELKVDFTKGELIYPPQLQKESNTISNFSKNENFVVFECVNRLLDKGYNPAHLILEKTWSLGHTGKSGKADITILDEKGKNILSIIECKTAGQEYNKAKKELFSDESGKQLFSYAAQARSTKWLDLYTSDFEVESKGIKIHETTLKIEDDKNITELAKKDGALLTFQNASQAKDLFQVWEETYNKKVYDNLIFSEDSKPYDIGVKPLRKKDLKKFDKDDGINVKFKEILRHNSISDKENAFNKLLSLFICKLVDEQKSGEDDIVGFQYKEGVDTYFTLYSRLLKLFHIGMDEFLKEDVFNIDEDKYIPNTLVPYLGQNRNQLIEELKTQFRNIKLISTQFFSFIEVYNEKLFLQNGKILVEMVELFQQYRLSYSTKQQFLSDLFEQLISEGFKQDEGQFFTPIPITRFVWDALPFESLVDLDSKSFPKVIDFACGAGHFLTEGISAVKDYLESKNVYMSDEEISAYFYGVDKDNRLAKLSKIAMLLNGANKVSIQALNGLEHDALFYDEKIENDKKQSSFYASKNAFDILVANPPFSVKGFKAHLKRKLLSEFETLNFISSVDKSIENVFVERITQILKPNGLVAIVLPSSILSNTDSSTIKTREILLTHFNIHAIVSFGSAAFGATGTNTVILFLRRFDEPPKQSELIQDSIEAILNNEDLQNFSDKEILESYLAMQGIDLEIYKKFLNNFEPNLHEYFKAYFDDFEAQSEIKNYKESKKFLSLETSEQKESIKMKFKDYVLSLEKEKLYYFALTFKAKTLIIKSPDDIANQKKFLGYEISNAKSKKAGLSEFDFSPLSDRKNRNAPNTLAFLIKHSFKGEFNVPSDLQDFLDSIKASVNYVPTNALFDFSLIDFKKAINLNISHTQGGGNVAVNPFSNCKYELVKLGEHILENEKSKIKVLEAKENTAGKYPFYTSGVNIYRYDSAITSGKNIYLSTGGNAIVQYYDGESAYSTDTYVIKSKNENTLLTQFLFVVLKNLESYINTFLFKGMGLKHLQKIDFKNLKIPLPPLRVQEKIVKECEKVEEQYKIIRMSIEEYQRLIKAILTKCGVVVSVDKANKDSINSILLILQELEQKLIEISNLPFKSLSFKNNKNLNSLLKSLPTPPQHGWEKVKLGEVCEFRRGPFGGSLKKEIFVKQGYKVYEQQNAINNNLSLGEYYITKEKYDSMKSFQVLENDLLVSCSGTIGKIAIITKEAQEGVINQALLRLRPLNIESKFLKIALDNMNNPFEERSHGSGLKNVASVNILKQIKIPLPPLSEQNKIITVVDYLENKIDNFQHIISTLESKKTEILTHALKDEV